MPETEYSILGPLIVRLQHDSAPVDLGAKLKLLLGRLLMEPGVTFPVGVLGSDVWGDEKPVKDVRNTVHAAVKQLRSRLLDDDWRRIARVDAGYRVVVADPLRIDAERFRQLAARGHALAERHPRAANAMLAEALMAWRGPVLGEHGEMHWAVGLAAELESLRDGAEVDLNEVRLKLGEYAEVEADLCRQIRAHPTDERRRAQLVRALDGAGRSAEAGLAYRDAARELGAPGPGLRHLSERIGRGMRAEAPPRAVGAAFAGRPDGALLHAVLADRPRRRDAPAMGTLALLVDRRGGVPYPTGEHELVAAFETPAQAAGAATAIAADTRLKPAVAVHVGAIIQLPDRLAGPGPARCRLLANAAHAGQVLVSEDARDGLDAETQLLDLGEQRLADLLGGERVYELITDAAPHGGFPAPASLSQRPNNLPVQQTRFVGRARELAELSHAVGVGRLITLLGVGGCGKTRLALQLAAARAASFTDGVWFVGLAELEKDLDEEALAVAIGNQLGVRALRDELASEALVRFLSDRSQLLVLDNCEHVLAACIQLVPRLRRGCPRVGLIVTSRQLLRVDGERVAAVPAMSIDAGDEPDMLSDAVALLLERAGSAATGGGDTLADATRICRAFEGSPLAIELAAAQISARGLDAVAAEVESMLRGELGLDYFATDDPNRPPRQRTIEAAIGWSYSLLDDDERLVLKRLAVFRGSFGMAEAQLVADDGKLGPGGVAELVRRLAERSMLASEPSVAGAARFRLSQPIRTFTQHRLEDAERAATRHRHARVYCALASAQAPELFGEREHGALERLEADHDNFRATLSFLLEEKLADEALALVGALWWLWFSHGHFEEGSGWVKSALALDSRPSRRRVRALRAASHLAWWRGDYALTDEYNAALEACANAIGDEWGRAWAPMGFGAVQMFPAPERALLLFEESRRRFQALGCAWEAGYALQLIGGARWFAGDESKAGEAYEEAVEIFERIGHGSVLASVRRGAGLMAARCGWPERGAALCRDALRFSDTIGDRAGSAQALNFLAAISRDEGEMEVALDRFAEALAHAREIGELWALCSALDGVAGAARAFGEPELAARLLARSARVAERAGYRQTPHERRLLVADTLALRATLGARDFERAVAEGQVMSVGEAVSAALAFAARRG